MITETRFRLRVTTKSTRPSAKAESVSALANSWSPVRAATMRTVTVVMSSSGLAVRLGRMPAAITTIMVSPSARETASSEAEMIPGSAAGMTTSRIVSPLVMPSASEPWRMLSGTEVITSSESDEMNGMIMMPMTMPGARALLKEASSPKKPATLTMIGATVMAAKKPYTTVGMPASTSSTGLARVRTRWGANSAM